MGNRETTTIEVSQDTWRRLTARKNAPGKSFDDVIRELLDANEGGMGGMDEETESRPVETVDDEHEPITHDAVEPDEIDERLLELVSSLELPGETEEKLEARREAVAASLAYLRAHETARPSDFKDHVFPSHEGQHATDNAWWKRTVSDGFGQLRDRGVVELAEKSTGTYRWVGSDE